LAAENIRVELHFSTPTPAKSFNHIYFAPWREKLDPLKNALNENFTTRRKTTKGSKIGQIKLSFFVTRRGVFKKERGNY